MRVSRPRKPRHRVIGRHNLSRTARGWIEPLTGSRFRKHGNKWCVYVGFHARDPELCRKTLHAAVKAWLS